MTIFYGQAIRTSLHLIAHQNDVSGGACHGYDIDRGDLPGLIDRQIIQTRFIFSAK